MLYALNRGEYVTDVPHKREYRIWHSRLSSTEFDAIYNSLMARIRGSDIETSSWIPGSDWQGTVYQPIYEKACQYDHGAAAKFFGLILWQVIMDHDAVWAFGRYENDGVPIEGMTYFQLKNPPPFTRTL